MPANSSISSSRVRPGLRFTGQLLLFVAVVAALDFGVGQVLAFAYFSQATGKFHRTVMAMEKTEADVLVFGSSRAIHHYDSRVLEADLGVKAYNAGARGQDIVYCYAVLQSVLHRYRPHLVLLNVDTRLFNREGKFERLSDLAPFYRSHPEIRGILGRKSRFESVKLLSSIYAYNSSLLHLINYNLNPQVDYDGFFPLTGTTDSNPPDTGSSLGDLPMDEDYLAYYKAFLEDCRNSGVPVVITVSPGLTEVDNNQISAMRVALEQAGKQKVPVWDFSHDPRFLNHGELFADSAHMNEVGARLFSELVAQRIAGESKLAP